MSIKETFDSLPPERKKLVIWCLMGAAFATFSFVGYKLSRSGDQTTAVQETQKTKEITLEPELIRKTMLREQRRETEALRKEIEDLKRLLGERNQGSEPAETEPIGDLPPVPTADQIAHNATPALPSSFPLPPSQQAKEPPPPPEQPEVIGAISVLTNESQESPAGDDGKKKAERPKRTVYLPPSFMAARLLTGFDASTSGEGKNNPEPLLLRVQTPAVLPNDVKANLRGCFVIAEAVGRLNKERADVRLVSLSCLSKRGRAVIDTSIKGFVTDSDSKVGLSGRVVSRMGAATARAVLAGLIDGASEAFRASTTTQAISPLGTTQIVDSSQLEKNAIGGGVAEGAKTLKEFYLDLAKQATPVIEVGAAREVTVVISEGKELEIKEFDDETVF